MAALKGSHWTQEQHQKIAARKEAMAICHVCKGTGELPPTNPTEWPYPFLCGACNGTGVPPEVDRRVADRRIRDRREAKT